MRHEWANVLSAEDYRAILRGNSPTLTWDKPEDVPFEEGDSVDLVIRRSGTIGGRDSKAWRERMASTAAITRTSLVSITVVKLRRTKKGAVVAIYSVKDDRGRYLAPKMGYTTSAEVSPDSESPSVDDDYLEKDYARREVDAATARSQAVQRTRSEKIRLERRLQDQRLGKRTKSSVVRQLGTVQKRLRDMDEAA